MRWGDVLDLKEAIGLSRSYIDNRYHMGRIRVVFMSSHEPKTYLFLAPANLHRCILQLNSCMLAIGIYSISALLSEPERGVFLGPNLRSQIKETVSEVRTIELVECFEVVVSTGGRSLQRRISTQLSMIWGEKWEFGPRWGRLRFWTMGPDYIVQTALAIWTGHRTMYIASVWTRHRAPRLIVGPIGPLTKQLNLYQQGRRYFAMREWWTAHILVRRGASYEVRGAFEIVPGTQSTLRPLDLPDLLRSTTAYARICLSLCLVVVDLARVFAWESFRVECFESSRSARPQFFLTLTLSG